jgi:hypothetical protein
MKSVMRLYKQAGIALTKTNALDKYRSLVAQGAFLRSCTIAFFPFVARVNSQVRYKCFHPITSLDSYFN